VGGTLVGNPAPCGSLTALLARFARWAALGRRGPGVSGRPQVSLRIWVRRLGTLPPGAAGLVDTGA
jgi:hypothetical protein